ncbi:hypothetical protein [Phytohalomonas tamaricis]|uniref:hypothetical protein n=1 Tax=Phytohalomonas tamaricis TaxID=2081032 RepID=UPI000D0BDF79|nr:hypothetical protein [Phytohalomonas tamaricis]
MTDARQIEWDTPDNASVKEHYEDLYFLKEAPKIGSVITARYKKANVRLQVTERPDNTSSVAQVLSITPDGQTSRSEYEDLNKGDLVIVADNKRAFVRYQEDD